MLIVFGIVLVLTNATWAFLFMRRDKTMLEMGKLLASRTLSEYSWLKAAEDGQTKKSEQPDEGYQKIWEDE